MELPHLTDRVLEQVLLTRVEPRRLKAGHLGQFGLVQPLQLILDLCASLTLDCPFFFALLGLLFVVDDAGEDLLNFEEFFVDGVLLVEGLFDAVELLVGDADLGD